MCLSGLRGLGLYRQGEVPGQELVDAADGMVGDLGEHGAEIELRIEAVQFCRSDQRVDSRGAFATRVGAGEKVILPFMEILA